MSNVGTLQMLAAVTLYKTEYNELQLKLREKDEEVPEKTLDNLSKVGNRLDDFLKYVNTCSRQKGVGKDLVCPLFHKRLFDIKEQIRSLRTLLYDM